MNTKKILLIPILFVFVQLSAHAQAGDDGSCQVTDTDLAAASSIVTELHDTLITIMKDAEKLGYQGRYAQVEPVIQKHYNTPLIVRTVLGNRFWDALSEAQQNEFIRIFQQLSIGTYADRFDGFNGEQFVELQRTALPLRGQCPAPAGKEPPAKRILIKTELRRVNDDPVSLEYLQQYIDGQWYIITVIANGVNDLSLKRGEYSDVIKKKGFDGLVEDIKTKINNLEKGSTE
ncbi:MAG: Toluene tolerance [Gammaproteobacteria bacterium]|nr:Toluene tolerance [Gammaproteobacteria bacterium]